MPASHFNVKIVKPMTGRPKFIVRHSTMPSLAIIVCQLKKKKFVIRTLLSS
jgi:hypothetical protein